MDQYPRMLYLAPGPHDIHGGCFDTLIVGSEDEQADAMARQQAPALPPRPPLRLLTRLLLRLTRLLPRPR